MPGKVFRFEILKFFVLPYVILATVILTLAHFDVSSQNNKAYESMIEYSDSLVDSYIRRLEN